MNKKYKRACSSIVMGKDADSPLTMGVFIKYLTRLEENMATKADIANVRAELKADIAGVEADIASVKADIASVKAELMNRLDKVESGTWSRLDDMEQRMATKDDLTSIKEEVVRIRKAMAEDDIDMAKVKKRLSVVEGAD